MHGLLRVIPGFRFVLILDQIERMQIPLMMLRVLVVEIWFELRILVRSEVAPVATLISTKMVWVRFPAGVLDGTSIVRLLLPVLEARLTMLGFKVEVGPVGLIVAVRAMFPVKL